MKGKKDQLGKEGGSKDRERRVKEKGSEEMRREVKSLRCE